MKTKVVQLVPRINFNVFKFLSFQSFQVPRACLTFRHFLRLLIWCLHAYIHYITKAWQRYSITTITALQYYSIETLQHYDMTTLQHYDITALQLYSITKLQHYTTVQNNTTVQHYSSTTLQHYSITTWHYSSTSLRHCNIRALRYYDITTWQHSNITTLYGNYTITTICQCQSIITFDWYFYKWWMGTFALL